MTISEATALKRAAAVRATFPPGPITTAQARAMVVALADSQVGYASKSATWSMYGKPSTWDAPWNGRQVYWCGLGTSWAFAQAFGVDAARAGIGWQNTNPNWPPAGWTATWLWLDWCRTNGRWVGMENAQPGDISLQSWGRTGKETDHVELVVGPYRASDDSYPTIGWNTATGNPTAGAGVQYARRTRWHTQGIYRPDWESLVTTYNAGKVAEGIDDLTGWAEALAAFGFPATVAGVTGYQTLRSGPPHHLVPDGKFGPLTQAALEADMATLEEIAADTAAIKTAVIRTMSEKDGESMGTGRSPLNIADLVIMDGARNLTTMARQSAGNATLARIEKALAEVNGHEVDVAELADLLRPDITEALVEAVSSIEVPGLDPQAIAKATTDRLATMLIPQED